MKNTIFLVLTATVIGCAPLDHVVYDNQIRQPTDKVDIYEDGQMPTRHYKVISELFMPGHVHDEFVRQGQIVEEAKRLGGNGLIFYVDSSGKDSVFRGKVIVYEP